LLGSDGKIRADWWRAKKGEVHAAVLPLVSVLDQQQEYRERSNLLYLQLYGGADYRGLKGNQYALTNSTNSRLRLNIVHSMCATVTSKIGKNKPRATFMTSGGNWSEQTRAKKLTKFVNGVFYETKLYEKARKVFLDATIFDVGLVKWLEQDGRICCERVFPNEVKVDDAEAVNGEPRSVYQVKEISREILAARFPEKRLKILDAGADQDSVTYGYKPDMVQVVEAWHLPSGPKAKDGRHTISVTGVDLVDEEWTKPYFPFVELRWDEMPVGWYGQGLASQLCGLQYEINKLLQVIQRAMHLSVPFVLVESGAKVNKGHINNELWHILEWTAGPGAVAPQYIVPQTVSPELLAQLDRLYSRAYEIAGVSQMSAQSQKPAGLNSGKALREFNDIESERFQDVGLRYEQFFMDCAERIVDLARDIHERDGSFSAMARGAKFVEELDWSEAALERDKYVMQVMPTAFLPATPAGRLDTVQEMLQAGLLSREDALLLLDYPDLESVTNLQNAAILNIDMRIERMLDPDRPEYHPPEPFTPHQIAKQRVGAAYEQAQMHGAPEENLELLRRYMVECDAYIQKAQAPAAPAAPTPPDAGAMPPEGMPPMPMAA
jgi:hypothetical protein